MKEVVKAHGGSVSANLPESLAPAQSSPWSCRSHHLRRRLHNWLNRGTYGNCRSWHHALDEAEYARFHELAQALTGLVFNDHRRPELERAVAEMLYATGLTDLASLYGVLEQAPASHPARIRFVRHLPVGETHFFRNEPQFLALSQHILPDLIERKRGVRQLRIWSAGCSTGKRPYSLAILLERLLPHLADWNVLLVATDINQDALQRAQQGVYGPWSFRQAPPALHAAYFTREGRMKRCSPATASA